MSSTLLFVLINAAESLTLPLAIPGVNLSCFCAGMVIGEGVIMSSAKCFTELGGVPCVISLTKTKLRRKMA